eukprot:TRINITY_DN45724_c0_g1_i1.p1 TRINITY_DN45724_c0_g1~~TRINITY_DN45724_c0_g1_i1.p1  ORF type:complete len:321 (-),score=15.83 TRINITY_DN45724_c0_g1_i1:262-1224(-)
MGSPSSPSSPKETGLVVKLAKDTFDCDAQGNLLLSSPFANDDFDCDAQESLPLSLPFGKYNPKRDIHERMPLSLRFGKDDTGCAARESLPKDEFECDALETLPLSLPFAQAAPFRASTVAPDSHAATSTAALAFDCGVDEDRPQKPFLTSSIRLAAVVDAEVHAGRSKSLDVCSSVRPVNVSDIGLHMDEKAKVCFSLADVNSGDVRPEERCEAVSLLVADCEDSCDTSASTGVAETETNAPRTRRVPTWFVNMMTYGHPFKEDGTPVSYESPIPMHYATQPYPEYHSAGVLPVAAETRYRYRMSACTSKSSLIMTNFHS